MKLKTLFKKENNWKPSSTGQFGAIDSAFKKMDSNFEILENRIENSTVDWNNFFKDTDAIQLSEQKPTIMEKTPFTPREPNGPLSQTDDAWDKNISFLQKEIDIAEKALKTSCEQLEQAKEDLTSAQIFQHDCQKKVYALKKAFSNLQSLIPIQDDVKKVVKKSVVKKAKTDE